MHWACLYCVIYIGISERSGPVSQDWRRNPPGQVLPGTVFSTSHYCWPGQHWWFCPSSGEWCPFPIVPALPATDGQIAGSWLAGWPVPAEQGQHAEDATWYVEVLLFSFFFFFFFCLKGMLLSLLWLLMIYIQLQKLTRTRTGCWRF